MWIMIAGPYTGGASNHAERAGNLQILNEAAWQLWRLGHLPVIGVNLALPVIAAAGSERFEEIMTPFSLALAERCDACLRIGGRSVGADAEVDRFRAAGKPIYFSLPEVPPAAHLAVQRPSSRT
jgi:hypothetical protein